MGPAGPPRAAPDAEGREVTRFVTTGVVWLSQTSPIRRRWRVYVLGCCVLSLPLRTVDWSRS